MVQRFITRGSLKAHGDRSGPVRPASTCWRGSLWSETCCSTIDDSCVCSGMELPLSMSQGADAVFETVPMLTFEELYGREYPGLIAVAWALSGSREDGEDLVHDTMVRALIGWRRVGLLERPGGWCHRVLVNRCRSWWRRSRTASAYLSSQQGRVPFSAGPSAEAVSFWAAVRTLPLRQRSVVALYYAGDLLVTEIAAVLAIPEGTVRSDLSRSRAVLAVALEVRDG